MLHSTIKYNINTQTEQTGEFDDLFLYALSAFGNQIRCRIYINGDLEYESDQIRYVKRYGVVNILKSIMYSVEIGINDLVDFKGVILSDVQFGVSEDGVNYYFVSFGPFTVTDSPMDIAGEYTTLTAYDEMLTAMKQYERITITPEMTLYGFLTNVATALGLLVGTSIPNTGVMLKTFVNTAPYTDKNTYRDILDDYSELLGGCIYIKDGKLELLVPTATNKTIDESNLISFTPGTEYEQISNVILTREGIEGATAYRETTTGNIINIANNQLIDYAIETSDFLAAMYAAYQAWGDYYPINAESYGYMLFEPMDVVTFAVRNISYRAIWMSSDITIAQGKTESIRITGPIDSAEEYLKSEGAKISQIKEREETEAQIENVKSYVNEVAQENSTDIENTNEMVSINATRISTLQETITDQNGLIESQAETIEILQAKLVTMADQISAAVMKINEDGEAITLMQAMLDQFGLHVSGDNDPTESLIDGKGLMIKEKNGSVIAQFTNSVSEANNLNVHEYLSFGSHRAETVRMYEYDDETLEEGTGFFWVGDI